MFYDSRWERLTVASTVLDPDQTTIVREVESKPAVTLDAIGEVLMDAADCLERRGLSRYALEDDFGRVCLYGALFRVTRDRELRSAARVRLIKYLGESPVTWVLHCRDTEQAVDALRAAAW